MRGPETRPAADDASRAAANKQIAGAFLAALGNGAHATAPWITDDFVWHMCRSTEVQFPDLPIDAHGIGGLEMMRGIEGALYDETPPCSTLYCCVSEGDMVAMHYTMTRQTHAGLPYENDYCVMFKIRDGKVARVWKLGDSLHGKRQYDAVPPPASGQAAPRCSDHAGGVH